MIPDMNDDGYDELAIGALYGDHGTTIETGYVALWFGGE